MATIVLLTFIPDIVIAQSQKTDSLILLLKNAPADSNRVKTLMQVASTYYFSKPDSCLFYSKQATMLSDSINFIPGSINARNNAGEAYRLMGNYPAALKEQKDALALSEKNKDIDGIGSSMGFIGLNYVEFGEYRQGLQYLQQALIINKRNGDQILKTFVTTNIGNAYDLMKMPDSALYYQKLAAAKYQGLTHGPLKSLYLTRMGNAFSQLGQTDSAMYYYQTAMRHADKVNDKVNEWLMAFYGLKFIVYFLPFHDKHQRHLCVTNLLHVLKL